MILLVARPGPVYGVLEVEPWGSEVATVYRGSNRAREVLRENGWRMYEMPYVSAHVWRGLIRENELRVHLCVSEMISGK